MLPWLFYRLPAAQILPRYPDSHELPGPVLHATLPQKIILSRTFILTRRFGGKSHLSVFAVLRILNLSGLLQPARP